MIKIIVAEETDGKIVKVFDFVHVGGTIGLEAVNPATGSVRLTRYLELALAAMLYSAGVRPGKETTESTAGAGNVVPFGAPKRPTV